MIERTFDYRRVKRLTSAPICASPEVFYLVEAVDGSDMGVVGFHKCHGGYMVHVEMKPDFRGKKAAQSYLDAFEWMFTHTDCEKIIGEIPVELRAAQFMARHVGAAFDGIDAGVLRCYSLTKSTFNQRFANGQ